MDHAEVVLDMLRARRQAAATVEPGEEAFDYSPTAGAPEGTPILGGRAAAAVGFARGETGYTFHVGNAEVLAARIEDLLANQAQAELRLERPGKGAP